MAKPVSGKPSLIDNAPSAGGAASSGVNSIRMLDALDSGTRPAHRAAARRGFSGVLAGAMLIAACGAGWSWWSQRQHTVDPVERVAQINLPVASAPAMNASPSPVAAASVAAEGSPAATIISKPEPDTPAAASTPSAVAPATSPPTAAAQTALVDATCRGAANTTKTMSKASPSKRDTCVAAEPIATRARASRTAAAGGANRSAAAALSSDPDVALLNAMLATMSREAHPTGPNNGPSAQTQMTIAQLVQRCDARGVKDAIETFECKRRICDGYWGKADACPTSLSPKKN